MTTDIEKALNDGIIPWTEIEYRTKDFWIFSDPTTPVKEYLCFVPVSKTADAMYQTYKAAYKWGYDGIQADRWQGFNLVQTVGAEAGQSVDYPHIHMIPRRTGDLDALN
jgi:diadenosine tetraphosphate (Ap4A) HIT family hydrolase